MSSPMRLRLWSNWRAGICVRPIRRKAPATEVAGLGRDDELVAMAAKVGAQDITEGGLGRARRGPVIVGEVEMGDSEIESPAADALFDSADLPKPKLCHKPSEIAGNLSPLLPQRLKSIFS